jgi:16S rRNA processing protein RimM
MQEENKSRIIVGRTGGAHGVRGLMKIMSYTRPKKNIFTYSPWMIHVDKTWQQFELEESQHRGDRLLVKLAGVESPEQARLYMNCDIAIRREQLPELGEGEYYWHDLLGLEVINQDQISLGKVSEIVETGANDVLVINSGKDKKNILIPLVMDVYVKQVDLTARQINVDWQIED